MPEGRPPVMKVRPFSKIVESPLSRAVLPCSGSLDGETFVLRIGQGVHRIATVGIGSDQRGEFAKIHPSRIDLDGGFVLEIEQEFPDDPTFERLPGCEIKIVRRPDQPTVDRAVLAQGFEPSAVNVLVPPEAVLFFSFHAEGQLTAWGGTPDFPHRTPTTTH